MSEPTTIEIRLNGEPLAIEPRSTVAALVASRGLVPAQVAVEVNKSIVPRAMHAETTLEAGDRVEIVTLVGGG